MIPISHIEEEQRSPSEHLRVTAGYLSKDLEQAESPADKESIKKSLDILHYNAFIAERAEKNEIILNLPKHASDLDIKRARKRQAVRVMGKVFLPLCEDNCIPFPNSFLRSALFSTAERIENLNDYISIPIIANKTKSLLFSGTRLCMFDQRVYTACLHIFNSIPLTNESTSYHITAKDFIRKMMSVPYAADTHWTVLKSLARLRQASIIANKGTTSQITSNLLRCDFETNLLDIEDELEDKLGRIRRSFLQTKLSKSEQIQISIPDQIASFFGRNSWTALPRLDAHRLTGLTAWLACYYASHSKSFKIDITNLHSLSGENKSLHITQFRKNLVRSLATLSLSETDEYYRVRNFVFSKQGKTEKIEVFLCRWKDKTSDKGGASDSSLDCA